MSLLRSLSLSLLLTSTVLISLSSHTGSHYNFKHRNELLQNLTGHLPNLENILKIYYEICPGHQRDCNRVSSNVSHVPVLLAGASQECQCSCSNNCVLYHNCCPGNVHGYLPYKCVNVGIYPTKSWDNFLMITSCPSTYSDDNGTVEKCNLTNSQKDCPVTSFTNGITYSSAACARCNGENNVTQWRVNITCRRNPSNLFKSADKFNAMLKEYDCQTFYWLKTNQRHSSYRPATCNASVELEPRQTFHSCNMTGLWQDVNEDVKWACDNLHSHFGRFNNVFCFICNPSATSRFVTTTIDHCNTTGQLTHETTLASLCKRDPAFRRLAPYKNMYCMLCNSHGFKRNHSEGYTVRENITTLGLSIAEITVEVQVDKVWNMFDALNEFYNQTSLMNYTSRETDRVFFDKHTMSNLKDSYVSACGDKNICRSSQEYHRYLPASIPMCKPCDCRRHCFFERETCCPDLILHLQPHTCIAGNTFLELSNEQTKHIPEVHVNTSFQIIDRCVRNSIYQHLCEIPTNETAKLESFVPIASHRSNFTYKNIYCYLCNSGGESSHTTDDKLRRISFNMALHCNTLLEAHRLSDFRSLIDVSSKVCSISFVPHTARKCGAHSSGNYFDNQPDIETFTRSVKLDTHQHTYTRCNETGNWHTEDEPIRHVCEGTTESILTLPVYKYDYMVYKNFACFICNPNNPTTGTSANITSNCKNKQNREKVLQCTKRGYDEVWLPFKNYFCADCNQPPIHICNVFKKNGDPYATPVPPRPWLATTPAKQPGLPPTPHPLSPKDGNYGSSFRFLFSIHHDEWMAMESHVHGPSHHCNNGTWDTILKSCRQLYCDEGRFLENNTCHVVSEVAANTAYVLKLKLDHVTDTSQNSTEPLLVLLDVCGICNDVLIQCTGNFDIETEFRVTSCNVSSNLTNKDWIIVEGNNTDVYMTLTLEIIATHHLTNVETALIGCLDKTYNVHAFYPLARKKEPVTFQSSHLTDMEQRNLKMKNVTCPVTRFKNVSTELTGEPFQVSPLMLCPQVQLVQDEFELCNETGEVYVLQNDLNKTEKEFRWHDTSVRICQYEQPMHKHRRPRQYLMHYYQLFSRISISLSLVGLLLTFVTYCIFPILRTLPGKNIMVLTYNMFLAQACLEFAPELLFNQPYCTIAGAFLHYFWLSTFCAMNLCSYHMFKIFCLKFFESHSFTFQRPQFLRYIAYVQGTPLVAVVFTMGVHMSLTKGTYTGYGYTKCFLSDIYSLVLAFLVPATVIFLMNIVFFIAVAQKIRSTPNLQRSTEKSDFLICVKICAIVGVSYPLQIVDGVMQLSALSFIATALNGLQGVYIFMAYVCNKRVFGHYMSLYARCRAGRRSTGLTTSLTSESLPSPTSWTTASSQSLRT